MKNHKHVLLSLLGFLILGGLPAFASSYIVQTGDTLSAIASRNGTTASALAETNGLSNPNLIFAGQTLELDQTLGIAIPIVVAQYTDSLASKMTNTASSFTLVRATDKQSRALNGLYGFVIDEGTSVEEFVTATCVSTACTVVTRGIDVVDGKSSVTALKFEHKRGAIVKLSNYPQLTILTRILNGQESASSTLRFGDGTTTSTAYKTIFADNGTTNFPFIRYNESLSRWQFSDDGLNTTNWATSSASGLSASSTKGIFFTDSQVGINASSSRSLAFDSNGYLYVTNNFTGTSTFSGNVTTTGVFVVQTPTSSQDATNKFYVDNRIVTGSATGTVSVAVTTGTALYANATGTLAITDTARSTSTFGFVGIALNSVAANATVTYAKPGSIARGLSNLKMGSSQYLNGVGTVSSTAGTFQARVGLALSSTEMEVLSPKYTVKGYSTYNCGNTVSSFVNLGFYPALVTLRAAATTTGATSGIGTSYGDDANTNVGDTAGGGTPYGLTRAWDVTATNNCSGTLSRSSTGFTFTDDSGNGSVVIQYVATSD